MRLQAYRVFVSTWFSGYRIYRLHWIGQLPEFLRVDSLSGVIRILMNFFQRNPDKVSCETFRYVCWSRWLSRVGPGAGRSKLKSYPARLNPIPFWRSFDNPYFSKMILKASWNSFPASRAEVFFNCHTGIPSERDSGIDERMPIRAGISRWA